MKNFQRKLNTFNKEELAYMNNLVAISTIPYLTNNEILENIKLFRETGITKYSDAIIKNFIKLLIKKARKYKKFGIDIGDLIHYGIIGLSEAIEKSFCLTAEEKFITYITIIIERRMKDGLDNQRGAVMFPKNIMTQQRKKMHDKKGSDDPKSFDVSDNIIYSKINIEDGDFVPFENEIDTSIEDFLDKESLQFDIFYILETILTPVERDIIIHSFGLNGESAKAFDAIGNSLEISAQKVRKIRGVALNKVRSNSEAISILKKYLT